MTIRYSGCTTGDEMPPHSCLAAPTARWLLMIVVYAAVAVVSAEASAARLTVRWNDNSNGTARTTVERRLEDADAAAYMPIADIAPGATAYVDESVDRGTRYCYRTRAYDADVISSYSAEACAVSTDGYQLTLTVKKTGQGAGTVVTYPTGMSCGTACSGTFPSSRSVTLVARPAPGSKFEGWSGGGCAGSEPCVLAGNTSLTVTATFSFRR